MYYEKKYALRLLVQENENITLTTVVNLYLVYRQHYDCVVKVNPLNRARTLHSA